MKRTSAAERASKTSKIKLITPVFTCLRTSFAFIVFATLCVPSAADAENGLIEDGIGMSTPEGVSADGLFVAGTFYDSFSGRSYASIWMPLRYSATYFQALDTDSKGWSAAEAISSDGKTLVGYSDLNGHGGPIRAVRWSLPGGVGQPYSIENLGVLNNGDMSSATGVSSDGSVVVGLASDGAAGNLQRAFRWTQAGGMQSLGTINGFSESIAKGASGDGSVVVGWASSGLGPTSVERAFRWSQSSGMQSLGTLDGGMHSRGVGVSGDGSVVVGWSDDLSAGNALRAFRWTEANGMQRLGVLNNGFFSSASAVSVNGQVVVGWSHDGAANNVTRGFRWTQATGMQSVEQWLRGNGVSVPTDITSSATATNTDGSVVVGSLQTGAAYIARVSGQSNGLVTLSEVANSLQSTAIGTSNALRSAGLLLNGAHSRPLSRRVDTGKKAFWVAGDWGHDDHGERNGTLGLAEIGGGYHFEALQVNMAMGQTWARQNLALNGRAQTDGTFVLAEALVPLRTDTDGSGLWATFGTHYHWGDTNLRRGYLNAGLADASKGTPDTETWGLRARIDWENAARLGKTSFSPYAELSYSQARMDSYTETGGGFPARFDSHKEKATEFRLGLNADYPLSSNQARLLGTVEAVHRLESQGASTSGQMIGLFPFDLGGESNRKNWLRLSAGVEGKVAGGKASLSVNATSQGEAPNYWLAASYQLAF